MKFRQSARAGGALLVLLTALAYLPALKGGFIWDDDSHLTENSCIVGPLGFKGIWTSSAAVYYPLVLSSFWLLHALWGLNPLPYHLVNIAMHAVCAVVLWRVLLRLGVRGAWLGAAVWALHPVQAESVAWITELKNTQSCLFYLLAILLFVKWRQASCHLDKKGGSATYLLVLVCAGMAILSKASTVMLPVVLGLSAWWMDGRWRWRGVVSLIPFFLVSGAASVWTIWEQKYHSGALGPEWTQSWPERVVIAGRVVWFYLGKLVWPHPLMFIYPRWEIDAGRLLAFLPALAAAAGLLVVWWRRNAYGRSLFFALGYFVVSLFPVLGFFNVYFFRYSYVGDHFEYLASMGPLALAGAVITVVFEPLEKKNWFLKPLFCGALFTVLGVLTWEQAGVFRDNETLWRDTLAKNPACSMAHDELGIVLGNAGKWAEAQDQFEQALRIKPDFAEAQDNLGSALARAGRVREGIEHMRRAVLINPNYDLAYYNLGMALVQTGEFEEAVRCYEEVLRINLNFVEAHNRLAEVLVRLGRMPEAMARWERALQLNPDFPDTHNNLGIALMRAGRLTEAVAHFEAAVRIKPDYVKAHFNLGNALTKSGRLNDALQHYTKALKLNPDYAEAHFNLGGVLVRLGRKDEAIAQFLAAVRIKPGYTEAEEQLRALGAAVTE